MRLGGQLFLWSRLYRDSQDATVANDETWEHAILKAQD
jgi:hypothetical protein